MNMPRTMIVGLIALLAISIYIKHYLETSWETFKLENSCYVTALKEGERNVPHAVGLGVIMLKGPDMESWNCNGQIIWKEVADRQRPS